MYTGGYHDRDRRIRKVPIRSDDSDGVGIFIPAQENLRWLNIKIILSDLDPPQAEKHTKHLRVQGVTLMPCLRKTASPRRCFAMNGTRRLCAMNIAKAGQSWICDRIAVVWTPLGCGTYD